MKTKHIAQLRILLLIMCVLLTSCQNRQQADLILMGANIYTVDQNMRQAEAVAIKDGKFIAVGTNEQIRDSYQSQQTLDLQGRSVYPGFIDGHCHFYGLGINSQQADLMGTTSYNDMLERLVSFTKENPSEFILGRGWDQNDWEDTSYPTKKGLDSLFPETAVVLTRIDGHAYLVNQKALELAGITPKTKVAGGEIVLKDGELTGVLIDNPMELIKKIIPSPSKATMVKALLEAQEQCFQYGLTTVNDAGLSKQVILLIDSLQQAGVLDMRIYAMINNTPSDLDYFIDRGVIKTDKLHVQSVKAYADGALGSRGAALKEPYSDQHHHFGAMVTPVSQIQGLANRLAKTDFQLNTHAIGDSANVVVLKAYQRALAGKENKRWKVEHAQIIDRDDFHYFSDNIIASVQPTHATSDMYWAEERLGSERIKGAYAYKDLLDQAGRIVLGTDFPVEYVSPFLTFYAATARRDVKGYPADGFYASQALNRGETLKGMTIWAAYSNFEEDEKGSIEVGKWADFVILDKDIMTIPLEEIPTMKAHKTFLAGKQVY